MIYLNKLKLCKVTTNNTLKIGKVVSVETCQKSIHFKWVLSASKREKKGTNCLQISHFFGYKHCFLFIYFQYLIFRVAKGPFFEDFYQCVTHGFYSAPWQEQLYTTFTLIFMFIIPLVILTGTYLSTFRTIASKYDVLFIFSFCFIGEYLI